MRIGDCIKKIEKYLNRQNTQPVIVDVQNSDDLMELITHFNVGDNRFIRASEFAAKDELPNLDAILNAVSLSEQNCFVTGLSAVLKFQGERFINETLRNILALNVSGRLIVFTHQCKRYLEFYDPRLVNRIWIVDGEEQGRTSIVFASLTLPIPDNETVVHGIEMSLDVLERTNPSVIYIATAKVRDSYPHSLYSISDYNKAYAALCKKDALTYELDEGWGSEEQWSFALQHFVNHHSWVEVIDFVFGNHNTLDHAFYLYNTFEADKKWMLFIALKLYGASNNDYLSRVVAQASKFDDLIKYLYRSLLDLTPDDLHFIDSYKSRKQLLSQIGNPIAETIDYCKLIYSKGKKALYYITDNTPYEKEIIISLLDLYAVEMDRIEVENILSLIYPALSQYLAPYRFKDSLLNNYFQEYKYQKVINKVYPEFVELVTEQASLREYNAILSPRASIIEDIDRYNAQLYFFDALGVEYLGYIVGICKSLNLMASIKVCRCELPSLTTFNKEFLDLFSEGIHSVVSIKDLDEVKHHGKGSYNYEKVKIPIHLIRELDIIREVLNQIQERLLRGVISKAVIVSDHGASRLAVINEAETVWEMKETGKYSGRCCLKNEIDTQPDFATDAGDFWALANYDRFKGGRKACVEVHGGATLEEIVVPIIEISVMPTGVEVYLMPENEENFVLGQVPVIMYSYKKKAVIKLFSTTRIENVTLCVDGIYYDGVPAGECQYTFVLEGIKRPKTYYADVYVNDNLIAEKQEFIVKNIGMTSSGKGIL